MNRALDARDPAAVLVNGLGDHLIALPALRALSTLFPGRLSLVAPSRLAEAFFTGLPLRRTVDIGALRMRAGGGREPVQCWKFDTDALAAKVGRCDLLASLNSWHSPVMQRLIDLLAPAPSVGFGPAFDVALRLDHDRNSFDLMFEVPRAIEPALRIEDFAAPPTPAAPARARAQALRRAVPASMRVLAVHADTKPDKVWAPRRLANALRLFLAWQPQFLVFVLGRENLLWELCRYHERVVPCFDLELPLSLALVGEADLFLGVDSCLLHAADLFRVPGVGLFGPTDPAEFGFRFAPHRHVYGGGSMEAIHEDEVLGALDSLLAGVDGRAGQARKAGTEGRATL